jgi:hypothetical protein
VWVATGRPIRWTERLKLVTQARNADQQQFTGGIAGQSRSLGTGRRELGWREFIGDSGGSAPVFNLQSLPGANALEDAGLVVDEPQ